MKRLWAPWRATYVESAATGDSSACFLCDYWNGAGSMAETGDAGRGIVRRWRHWYAVLNAYPYTNGHLMLVLARHHEGFAGLSADEGAELAPCLQQCETALRDAYAPHGLNLGVNMGRAGGAGVVGHLHVHLVPRWNGDTNFMTAVGETRVLPESLEHSQARLAAAFARGGSQADA
jgi:ATP adenylyltransferase